MKMENKLAVTEAYSSPSYADYEVPKSKPNKKSAQTQQDINKIYLIVFFVFLPYLTCIIFKQPQKLFNMLFLSNDISLSQLAKKLKVYI